MNAMLIRIPVYQAALAAVGVGLVAGGVGYYIGTRTVPPTIVPAEPKNTTIPQIAVVVEEEAAEVETMYYFGEDQTTFEDFPKIDSEDPPVISIFADENGNIENVVRNQLLHWDWDAEIKSRTDDEVFVIHYTEFGELKDYDTLTLFWYDGDGVLSDDSNHVYGPESIEDLLGDPNSVEWGHGSDASHTIHLRNPMLETDFMVIKFETSFSDLFVDNKSLEHGMGKRWKNRHFDDD